LVLFWSLDRFSREGMAQTVGYLQRLQASGVDFHSYAEEYLATDNELVRNILLAMIEDTLEGAKTTRYRHAARHLRECRALEPAISDHGSFETHDASATRLQARHDRKTGFWSRVAEHSSTAGLQ
jgi:hypothetical protein